MEHEIILKYFPQLTPEQIRQFKQLGQLYPEWNAKINVISRQDIGNLYERHILHSLGIAKVVSFNPGTRIMDAGTGGGLPGIPLAILFPEAHFHLVDSTAKKLSVVRSISEAIGLKNISTEHCRFEEHFRKYDFIVSRAVSTLDTMVKSLWKNVDVNGSNDLENGILCLKGGDLREELGGLEAGRLGDKETGRKGDKETGRKGDRGTGRKGDRGTGRQGESISNRTIEQLSHKLLNYAIYPLSDYFEEDFFQTKMLIHLF